MHKFADSFKTDKAFNFFIKMHIIALDKKSDEALEKFGSESDQFRSICGDLSAYKHLENKSRRDSKNLIETYLLRSEPKTVFKKSESAIMAEIGQAFGIGL